MWPWKDRSEKQITWENGIKYRAILKSGLKRHSLAVIAKPWLPTAEQLSQL